MGGMSLCLVETAEGFGQPLGGQDVVDLVGDDLGAFQVAEEFVRGAEPKLHGPQPCFELRQGT